MFTNFPPVFWQQDASSALHYIPVPRGLVWVVLEKLCTRSPEHQLLAPSGRSGTFTGGLTRVHPTGDPGASALDISSFI